MSSKQLTSVRKRLAGPPVWQLILSMAVLIAVIGVAATVRRPVSIGPGNPKYDFFSGPLIESRQQSGLTAKPYWDRVRIALTIKSKPADQLQVVLRVRDSDTRRIVRESTATIPAQRTYPTDPLWIEFRFKPIESRFPATIEVFPLDDEEAHRIFAGTSRGDRFEAGSLVPFDPATGDQDLTFIYEGPESLLRHGAALARHFTNEASRSSMAVAWALVISSLVCLGTLAVSLGSASNAWSAISRILLSLALLIVAAEAAFLLADQVASEEQFRVQPAPGRWETASLIAWPMVVAALMVGLGRAKSGNRPRWVTVPARAARQLTATGVPLAIMAAAVTAFGDASLGGNMAGAATAVLACAVVLATLSAVSAARRFRQ